MTLTALLIPTYRQMLQALALWLRKAEAQVDDADALLSARLAPDMFPLSTQVRFACRQAYEGIYRLRHEPFPAAIDVLLDEGRNAGDHPGTMAEALARVDEALAFLDTLAPDALDAGAGQPLELSLPMGLTFDLDGEGYAQFIGDCSSRWVDVYCGYLGAWDLPTYPGDEQSQYTGANDHDAVTDRRARVPDGVHRCFHVGCQDGAISGDAVGN